MAAIQITNLTKKFNDGGLLSRVKRDDPVVAVDNLSLEVDEGEIFGFLGPNGAGKSTTINILLDYVRPTEGRATVLGMDAQEHPADIHDRIGVLPENTGLWDRLSARQHVELAIRTKESDDDAETILERVGLEDAVDRQAGGFSTGMRQRLGLAMALVGDPDLLILDEPTAGLDPNGVRLLRQILREEVDRGATVFFSSHVLEQVEAICDRVAILRDGQLVALDTIEQLREELDAGSEVILTVDAVPENAQDRLQAVDGVAEVQIAGREIVSTCTTGPAKIAVVDELRELGATIQDQTIEDADLETLFAAFAGERGEGGEKRAAVEAEA